MFRPKLVVFDLDGTLIDSREDIAAAANHALGAHGFPTRTVSEITSFVGDGARQLVARAAELSTEAPQVNSLLLSFMDYYAKHPAVHTKLLPGVRAVIAKLDGYALGLCTNKPRSLTDLVLKALDLNTRFTLTWAGGDSPEKKPDPTPLLKLGRILGIDAAEMVIVGDGTQDIECGRRAGARTVAVKGGMGSTSSLLDAGPDAYIELIELPELLSKWERA